VSEHSLTYYDLMQIVEWLKTSAQFGELHLKMGETELHIRRQQPAAPPAGAAHLAPAQAMPSQASMPTTPAVPPPPPPSTVAVYPDNAIVLRAPMVGTFYRAPEPGAPPFVTVGQHVAPDTTVCIIEVMKLMHSMPAQYHGVVTHILVEDAQPVEYGQALLVLTPSAEGNGAGQPAGATGTP